MHQNTLFNLLGNYRIKQVYIQLVQTEFAEFFTEAQKSASLEIICEQMGWNFNYGSRFVEMLVGVGLLECGDDFYTASESLIRYFSKSSKYYQGHNILFENSLENSWQTLDAVLRNGERVFQAEEKTTNQYKQDLELYIRAMDNVASLRACELFDVISFPDSGEFIDVAGGSGAYIFEFLERNKNWTVTYFDLPDVRELSQRLLQEKLDLGIFSPQISSRIIYSSGNFLEEELTVDKKYSCILLSNIIHCYSVENVKDLLLKCKRSLSKNGMLVIHDFFKNTSVGTVYDVHMMLNTYSGQTYFTEEIIDLMQDIGLKPSKVHELPSQSVCMVFE